MSTDAEKDKAKSGSVARRAPVLVEMVAAVSKLVLLLAVLAAALLTWLADGSPLVAVLRAGLTLAALGVLLWTLNYLLAEGVLNARVLEAKTKHTRPAPPPQPTVEVEA